MHTIPSGLVIVNKHCEHFSLADSLLLLVVFCLVGFLSFFFSCPPQKTTPNRNELRWNEQKYAKDYDREEKHLYAVFNPLTITILHNLSLFDVTTLYKNCFPFFHSQDSVPGFVDAVCHRRFFRNGFSRLFVVERRLRKSYDFQIWNEWRKIDNDKTLVVNTAIIVVLWYVLLAASNEQKICT